MCITIPCNYTRRLHINCPPSTTAISTVSPPIQRAFSPFPRTLISPHCAYCSLPACLPSSSSSVGPPLATHSMSVLPRIDLLHYCLGLPIRSAATFVYILSLPERSHHLYAPFIPSTMHVVHYDQTATRHF